MSLANATFPAHRDRNIYDVMTPARIMELPEKERPEAYALYLQRELGIPWPTQRDMVLLKRKIKEIFDQYPHATYFSLCRIADWCKVKKRRFERVWMVPAEFRKAWAAGYLPELDSNPDQHLEQRIQQALEVETRSGWRQRLMCAAGTARREALEEWEKSFNSM